MREEVEDELEAIAAVYANELIFCHRDAEFPLEKSSHECSHRSPAAAHDSSHHMTPMSEVDGLTRQKGALTLPVVLGLRFSVGFGHQSDDNAAGTVFAHLTIGLPPEYPDAVPLIDSRFTRLNSPDNGASDPLELPRPSLQSAISECALREAEACLSNGGVGAMLFQMIEAVRTFLVISTSVSSVFVLAWQCLVLTSRNRTARNATMLRSTRKGKRQSR
eukprot:799148-Rhodomonas_salina.1